ncbi:MULTISPECIES: conjugal transfer protein [Pseudomonas syringae group]|uniref:Uncharacterized protein n=2 Tax=Pseudomonas syringae group TaxID=136849 RepID=A0A3M2W0H3_PSESI|nr:MULTISPECIES: conjugal transfer protein [Pseudomonas syringae group]RML44986.1 hypothetical protein ALQ95_200115 [Pseudomonas syringae pv. ribicola]RMV48539.1 hypothetical protein ALP09_200070 [Pseudomonas amygdali pv. lachrymans]
MKVFLMIVCFSCAVGCTQKQQLPADVTGDLVPINKSQVIDYER